MAGEKVHLYIERVNHTGDYTVFYLSNGEIGRGSTATGTDWYSNDFIILQDLDHPLGRYYIAGKQYNDEGLLGFSFEKVQGRRFSLRDVSKNPGQIFAEIILGEPD
jgi:hypothetical protein